MGFMTLPNVFAKMSMGQFVGFLWFFLLFLAAVTSSLSMLQPAIAGKLQQNKLRALNVDQPDVIATANIGCQLHLAQDGRTPVVHWIELV